MNMFYRTALLLFLLALGACSDSSDNPDTFVLPPSTVDPGTLESDA